MEEDSDFEEEENILGLDDLTKLGAKTVSLFSVSSHGMMNGL